MVLLIDQFSEGWSGATQELVACFILFKTGKFCMHILKDLWTASNESITEDWLNICIMVLARFWIWNIHKLFESSTHWKTSLHNLCLQGLKYFCE